MAPPMESAPFSNRMGGSSISRASPIEVALAEIEAKPVPPGYNAPGEDPEDYRVPVASLPATRLGITPLPRPPVGPPPLPPPAEPVDAPVDVLIPDVHADNPIRRKGKRQEFYVTKARIQRYGETPGCYACMGATPSHTDACIAREA